MLAFTFSRRPRVAVFVITLAAAALVSCTRATTPEKNPANYAQVVRAFYVGLSALQVGDDVRAEEKLKEAAALAPQEPASWANLGLLYLRQREFDRAAENLEKAQKLAPESVEIHLLLGLLESSRGRYEEATAALKRAVELDPKNLKALYALSAEAERAGDEGAQLGYLQRILEGQPGNLSVNLEVARIAAKRGDAELFKHISARFAEQAAAWPPEAREQWEAVQAAAAGGQIRAAAPRVQFLRNVLVRLPEYRQSRLAVQDPPEVLGEPFTRFVILKSPSPQPAPRDGALTFSVETRPAAAEWGGALYLSGEGEPALVFIAGREAQLDGGAKLAFPGGTAAPSPHSVAGLDFNYDFKTDVALAGEGGFRLYGQEGAASFADVTAQTKLSDGVTRSPAAGVWAADV
ncbi:MAG TPA: tetratricopeptide repeat protein, partial [Pyrinomonadaceae bacterium]|nr:tetratricopeptide repeat protein [Pyrinomonadaceae bacterium]